MLKKDYKYFFLLMLAPFLLFWPAIYTSLNFHDNFSNILSNPYNSNFSLSNLKLIWGASYKGLYIPVPYTLWSLESQISRFVFGGPHSSVFAIFNILIHSLNGVFLFLILHKIIVSKPACFLGALLFLIHPIQVESVSWLTGFRDLLGAHFSLLFILLFLLHINEDLSFSKKSFLFAASLISFVLAMLSKPSAISAPLIVGAIIFFALRKKVLFNALKLSVFIIIALPFCYINSSLQSGFVYQYSTDVWTRPFVAADAVLFYLYKFLWPVTLTIDYGRNPMVALNDIWGYLGIFLLPALFILLFLKRNALRFELCAFLIFVFGVLPYLGLSIFQFQSISTVTDHYAYIGLAGFALLVANILVKFSQKYVLAAVAIALSLFAGKTFFQTHNWTDNEALYKHAVSCNPDSRLSNMNLGIFYARTNRLDVAEPILLHAYELSIQSRNHDLALILQTLSDIYVREKRLDENVRMLQKVVDEGNLPVKSLQLVSRAYFFVNNMERAQFFAREAARLRGQISTTL